MSSGFRFEYEPPDQRRRERAPSRRRGRRGQWEEGGGWWLALLLAGASASVFMAWTGEEIRYLRFDDTAFLLALGGILAVVGLSFPGFALLRLKQLGQGPAWVGRWWNSNAVVISALVISFVAALWSGYVIAIRIARDLTL